MYNRKGKKLGIRRLFPMNSQIQAISILLNCNLKLFRKGEKTNVAHLSCESSSTDELCSEFPSLRVSFIPSLLNSLKEAASEKSR